MLKSTHKPAAAPLLLPDGWTEHKAPTGHPYYYNAVTKESTYSRPTQPQQPALQILLQGSNYPGFGAGPFNGTHGGLSGPEAVPHHYYNSHRGRGDAGGRHRNNQRPRPRDRPKSKHIIPGCEPWFLITTNLARRFVYNPDIGQSFWKFPPEVMKGVVEYDRLEREKRVTEEKGKSGNTDNGEVAAVEAEPAASESGTPTAACRPEPVPQENSNKMPDSDGEEYEEVEVTDDEDEDNPTKRQKTKDRDDEQPVEFNEDDIAYQLAAMGQDYGLDPGEYGGDEAEDLEEGAEGLPLTEEDSTALFKDMLDDHNVNPYTTWEKLIEAGQIVEDDRYTVLPNMRFRKEVWGEWTRDKIQQLKERREKEEKKDPRIPYFAFLQAYATPKLYWPEFRRKYQKEPEMRNTKLSDKDREKCYREYIARLKLPESALKLDLVSLLKSISLFNLHRSTPIDSLPPVLLTDLRYISVRPSIRDPLIEAHISTLPSAPTDLDMSPEEEAALSKERQERERRQKALEVRQRQVEEEKRRQRGSLQYSKGMLREGEQEVQKAMKVGKDGLLGHMEEEKQIHEPRQEGNSSKSP